MIKKKKRIISVVIALLVILMGSYVSLATENTENINMLFSIT